MNNFVIEKKRLKCKNQEPIIKHYVLGYILECIVRKDYNIKLNIERFLVYELKIISLSTFLNCIQKIRLSRTLEGDENIIKCADLLDMIEIIKYDYFAQTRIVEKLQTYAENYDDGIYINSKMAVTNFSIVKNF